MTLAEIAADIRHASSTGILYPGDRISFRWRDGVWITETESDPAGLTEKDVKPLVIGSDIRSDDPDADLHSSIYHYNSRIGALISSRAPFCKTVSSTGEKVRPYVDDIAQMIGIDIKCFKIEDKRKIINQLKKRGAILLKEMGALCAAASLDDLLAAAMITEKACAIHVQASFIGGAKAINVIESALMRFVYMNFYSKKSVGKS